MHSLKSKFDRIRDSPETKERLKSACSGLSTLLRTAKDVASNSGIPGLAMGFTALQFLVDALQKTSQNAEDVEELTKHLKRLISILHNPNTAGRLSPTVVKRTDELKRTFNEASERARKLRSHNFVKRALTFTQDSEWLKGQIQAITWSIESFTVETILQMEFMLDEHVRFVQDHAGVLVGKVDQIQSTASEILSEIRAANGHLPHAVKAAFNVTDRELCAESTRTAVLAEIFQWIGAEDGELGNTDPELDQQKPCIFWLHGVAGTGKTTIAYTAARYCNNSNPRVLGASFFCSRDDANCSDIRLIFTTIAYQLSLYNPDFAEEVSKVLTASPDIGYASVQDQFEELIVNPLRLVRHSFAPCVIILDALDECKDTATTSTILSALSCHIAELSPLRFLVTSRPENHIKLAFKSEHLHPNAQQFILHDVALEVVEQDIRSYFQQKLENTRMNFEIEKPWPAANSIDVLVNLSSGLFIFAATSIKYIEDRADVNPQGRLQRLVGGGVTDIEKSSPFKRLDDLYTEVLKLAFPEISASFLGLLKMVLGSIVHLRDPLSLIALEKLLALAEGRVRETLLHLHAVLIVPENPNHVIQLLHPSFADFITNPGRCLNPEYVVKLEEQHTLLGQSCLVTMNNGLSRDICKIRNPSLLNSEVKDLPAQIGKYVPAHVLYACRHWAYHVSKGMISAPLLNLLEDFCEHHLLHWIEVCSLLGELQGVLLSLADVQKGLLAGTRREVGRIIELLRDCQRFTHGFFPVISTCALQIYHSALLFTPEATRIRRVYTREMDFPVRAVNAVGSMWDPCVRIHRHPATVYSVAFSPDGMYIASGSGGRKDTVRLWDTTSGSHLQTLKGPSSPVTSITFSPDGMHIASGSWDNTVRLWDIASGSHLQTLEGHSSPVTSVMFSPDGMHIASGSWDRTIRLWDTASGSHLQTLKGHSSHVTSVVFSPDGMHIASGSWDNTVRLWVAASGLPLRTLKGHSSPVTSVAFSPDGIHIACGFQDNTVRLWDTASGSHLRTLKGHSDWVKSVAFSLDGMHIASGSNDKTVRLWDTASGSHVQTLKGHSDTVNSVTFSPDGMLIASGSHDRTVRLWDTASGSYLQTLKGHSDTVTLVAFSPDTMHIAPESWDNTGRLWDTASSSHLQTLKGHSGRVRSVAFSPDGMHIASGSDDKTVRLWDTGSGLHLQTLNGHSDWVRSAAFSLDGMYIASGSDDKTVQLWHTASGSHLQTLEGHSDWVRSVAFSPDGMYIASGSDDKTVQLWHTASGSHLQTLEGHSDWVRSVAFSLDGMHMASGSDDKTVRLWDTASGSHLQTMKGHSSIVTSVVFSPDGMQIASGSWDNTVRLWDTASGSHLRTLKGHSDFVRSVAFSPDGMHIASGSDDKTVQLWDTASGSHVQTLKGHSDWVNSVAFSPDGMHIASGSDDETVRLWDTASGSYVPTLKGHSDWATSVTFSPDGKHIASGSLDKTVRLWDTASGSHLQTLKGHSGIVHSVAFSPDGMHIASGSRDNTARLWDTTSGSHLWTLKGHSDSVNLVAFSPDGMYIASGSRDNTVRLWDTASGSHLRTLRGHSSGVTSIKFSLDGMHITSRHSDTTIWIWDTTTGLQVQTLQGHSSTVSSVPPVPAFYMGSDGWIHSQKHCTHICWLPIEFKRAELATCGDQVALGLMDGRVIILDFSGVDSHYKKILEDA
ncbi:WD40-repeat-containing domain protein [Mycena galopus ATCC 62051]|nr:WD40-repeat-containing domain protein [Mycena galopus ATCC 62051]